MKPVLDRRMVAAFVAVLAALIVGVLMWLPTDAEPSRPSDLGAAIIGGAIVAFSVLAVDSSRNQRARARDELNRERVRDDQLRLTLNLQHVLIGVRLDGRDLSEAYLPSRILIKARMVGTNLQGAVLYRSDLQFANMTGANLRNADLGRCILNNALLDGADLAGCDLGSADLRRVNLKRVVGLEMAKLNEAVYDYATQWPDGFDPRTFGVREVSHDDNDPGVVWPTSSETRRRGNGRERPIDAGEKLDVGPVGYERTTPVRAGRPTT